QGLRIPPEQRLFMISLLVIAIAGQFTLTLNDKMFIWFVYLFVALRANVTAENRVDSAETYQLRLA
ncbi:MAG TPA: hypothetical protein PLM98_14730, partial [Thiolinea sp.]|nr:hypothetical protein [Thiolinea sp.]